MRQQKHLLFFIIIFCFEFELLSAQLCLVVAFYRSRTEQKKMVDDVIDTCATCAGLDVKLRQRLPDMAALSYEALICAKSTSLHLCAHN